MRDGIRRLSAGGAGIPARAPDACTKVGGALVRFKPGEYVTGALFIKSGVNFVNVTAEGEEAGFIEHARGWRMRNVKVRTKSGEPLKLTNAVNVESPEVSKK